VEVMEMNDEELYVPDDVWKRQMPQGTKSCLKIKIRLSETIGIIDE
jgi:hypothetical protein